MNVNHWHEYAAPITAIFRLTDSNGDQVNRLAKIGDYIKIDLPAPGHLHGSEYDWVHIETIEEKNGSKGFSDSIVMRVRPSANPKEKGENVAHFFKEDATSSFILERKNNQVKAAVYGRNEILNTETPNIIDKVRNAVVGVSAILGFSNIQWKNLVKGLIETKE
jgi:hypothetical protein